MEYPGATEGLKPGEGDGSPQWIVNMWAMMWGSKRPTPGEVDYDCLLLCFSIIILLLLCVCLTLLNCRARSAALSRSRFLAVSLNNFLTLCLSLYLSVSFCLS